ncbi:MAG TPA: MFS transporter, partial [Acetobacteraceae bacterium]
MTGALLLVPLVVRFLEVYGVGEVVPVRGPAAAPAAPTRRIPRPFEGKYPATVACAILALAPFIVVTTARALFGEQVQQDLHLSRSGMEIIAGLSTAGYAWGALWGGDIAQRLPRRPLFLVCEGVFVLGCLLAPVATGPVMYGIGHVLAGFATGLLLVVAVPPVVQRFPAAKLPITVVAINIGFFGAVCIGPLVGGWVAAGHHWRWFYAALAALGFANLLLAVLTLPNQPPPDPGLRFDWAALVLGLAATA